MTVSVPEGAKFCGATIFCPHPVTGECLYVSRRGLPERLGGVPGGKVDPGETYAEAAMREFFEETSFKVSALSEVIFSGIALKSGAYCHVFLGTLSDADWQRIEREYVGPEGLVVRLAPWERLMEPEECEFAEYNVRFFKHLQSNEDAKRAFKAFGLESVYDQICHYKIE
jgi:8-oxo-dGTP pyrophosphatase MutT (NUDIX family)